MRILFITLRFGHLKNFEQAILDLAARDHPIHLVALAADHKLLGRPLVAQWAARAPQITFERMTVPADPFRQELRARIHTMADYMRYLEPVYRDADGLLERAARKTPRGLLQLLARPGARLLPVRRTLRQTLGWLAAASDRPPEIDAFLRARAPDVVLFTPLIGGVEEQDFLAAAHDQGLRTVFCVKSWDNLSSKSTLRTMPTLVTVWNDVQRQEAQQFHAIPLDRVVVTGAPAFDHWFNRAPSRSWLDFASHVGLPSDRPFLLWVCSTLFRGSPAESAFITRWIAAIRASDDPRLREVSILIRPHPARLHEWKDVSLAGLGPTRLWGSEPVTTDAKNDYFDSLYYSAAVAGLNTSAMLDAAVVGRPVYTVLLPEHHGSQEGTLHFRYLMDVAGGLLHASRDLDAHLRDLADALREPERSAERSRRFVQAFIRPFGLDVSASSRFVTAIEDLARRPAPAPAGRPTLSGAIASRVYARMERAWAWSDPAWLKSDADLERVAARGERRTALRAEEKRAKAAARAEKAAAKAQKASQRADKPAPRAVSRE